MGDNTFKMFAFSEKRSTLKEKKMLPSIIHSIILESTAPKKEFDAQKNKQEVTKFISHVIKW